MTPNTVLERWACAPSLTTDVIPRPEAEVLVALLQGGPLGRESIGCAARRFAAACADTQTAVAHLLSLRDVVGPSHLTVMIDEQLLDLVARELSEARRNAHTDPLTGLGNRRALDEALPRAIAQAERTAATLGVIYFDLIGLKALNDRCGHDAGDDALRTFGTALAATARTSDLLYRVGGDEFVALLPDINPEDVPALIRRISDAGAPPFSWGSTNTHTEGLDPERLVRMADLRMLSSRYRLAAEHPRADDPVGAIGH